MSLILSIQSKIKPLFLYYLSIFEKFYGVYFQIYKFKSKMKIVTTKTILPILLLLILAQLSWAQVQTPLDAALRHVEKNRVAWSLSEQDVADLTVSDLYVSKQSGVTHVYFVQRYEGIELYNGILNVSVASNGKTYNIEHLFMPNLGELVNTTTPSLTPKEAIKAAAKHLGADFNAPLKIKEQISDKHFVFDKGAISHADIIVKLRYQALENKTVRLAWDLAIDQVGGNDYWSLRVDALTGEVIDKNSWTVHCKFDKGQYHNHDAHCREIPEEMSTMTIQEALIKKNEANANMMMGMYNVFPAPTESPSHGARMLVPELGDVVASPYGWHDTNGAMGEEYTITRGNNVHAYLDVNNTNSSAGDEPDGGPGLLFDFPFDPADEPAAYQDAATTNLFYMCNFMHDFTYHYGFDEGAGNFQSNNYGNGGWQGDYVLAEAQDGSGANNANFATPSDGGNGRMQMYVWDTGTNVSLTVEEPNSIAGNYEARGATFGGTITTPLTAEVAIVDDGTTSPTLGCNPLQNSSEVNGKIALVDRGSCEFGLKSLLAEEAGAIAVVVCNYEDTYVNMAPGADGDGVTIPAYFITATDCQIIRQFAGTTLLLTMNPPPVGGPSQVDGDFDNGIIAHEYAHGISNRLTGGPGAAGCLSSNEQMGEGWSDFFTLITTVKPGDTGEMRRGIGTYAQGQAPTGQGIRRYPYSTDMAINPQTYNDIIGTEDDDPNTPPGTPPHPVGEVWADMIWDLYWALSNEYGWSADLNDPAAGNNIAINLVMEGMKLQPCNPGFVNGRDAIILADSLMYDAEHSCLIWETFARRGLGFSADQGSVDSRDDGTEGYDIYPQCIQELKISKEVTNFIDPGEEIEVELTVVNHIPGTATNVVVTDEIPEFTSYVNGSASNGGTANAGMMSWDLGDLAFNETVVLTYSLMSDPSKGSISNFKDDMEDGDDNWELQVLENTNIWEIMDIFSFSGDFAWTIGEPEASSDQAIMLTNPYSVNGSNPTLRFFHRYDTETALDGGIVQLSTDGGTNWSELGPNMFRNGYKNDIAYTTFATPNLQAFSGNSFGWRGTYVDLSDYIGQDINIRWRFGTDAAVGGLGWFVDDVEYLELLNYNGEACVTADGDEGNCVVADEKGTVVSTLTTIATIDVNTTNAEISIFPNPANDLINISIDAEKAEKISLSLVTMDGKELMQQSTSITAGSQIIPLNIADLSAGFYFVKVTTETGTAVKKVVVE